MLPGALAQADTTTAVGFAVPIGGGLKHDHDAVWQRLVALAGGSGSRWVVLGTASESPLASAESAAKQLTLRGAKCTVLPVSPLLKDRPVAEVVRDPALVAQVAAASGVFFTGGSQDRIVDSLQPAGQRSPLLQAIWALHARGGVVAGTSAGAAIMSRAMFIDAPSVLDVLKGRFAEGREVGAGLGFVGPDLFVDQHFLRRGRLGRMLPVMHAKGYNLGLGVEENSAVVQRGSTLEVAGGKAVLADLRGARVDTVQGAFRLRGAHLSLLDRQDRYDTATGQVTPAEAKLKQQTLQPGTPAYKPYYTTAPFYVDMLGEGVLATALGQLIDASYDEVRGVSFDPRPKAGDALGAVGFEFRLYKTPTSIGWYTDAYGDEDYTVHRIGLDITPLRMAQPLYAPLAA